MHAANWRLMLMHSLTWGAPWAMLWKLEVDRDCGLPIGDMANLLLVLGAGTVVRVTVCYQASLSVLFDL